MTQSLGLDSYTCPRQVHNASFAASAPMQSQENISSFPPPQNWFSEATTGEGFRLHWKCLEKIITQSTPEELLARKEGIRRQLEEHGVSYHVYADAQGQDRPWGLDLFPFVIPQNEWNFIEQGLIQRTRLFNALHCDLYGPRRALGAGILPAGLLFAHPSFLRPCDGIHLPHQIAIGMHAINLARRPNGNWCVISDRTQAPSGLGYTLANRIVLSQCIPDPFRDAQVQRLASFFMALRENLRALAPRPGDSPVVALLTPGPFNETYFEQSFLARYLGFNLVEGGDLIIRNNTVCIKTLDGLRQVDILLRRVDDAYADPLEFNADSILGVPGLLGAIRAGNITMVNALGSTWLETPALHRYLPTLCRLLLGEELILPSVESLWCGDAQDRARVLSNPDQYVIKHTFGSSHGAHVFPSRLTADQKASLSEQIRFNPNAYTAQERIPLSRVPCLEDTTRVDRPVILRAFTSAGPGGVSVLPGGLTRVSTSTHRLIVSMQEGAFSKDTWVLSDKPVANISLLRPATQAIRLERAPAEVPSRVADNLFWLGRYAERLEDISRILRCILNRLTSEGSSEETPELSALIHLIIKLDLFPERFLQRRTLAGIERECTQLVFNTHRLGTVREVHGRLQNLAFTLRDRFSSDTQRTLSKLQSGLKSYDTARRTQGALAALNHIMLHLAAFNGLEMENMTRGHAWRFLDMGRRLERAINVITLLQTGLLLPPQDSNAALVPLLEIADSVITYRRRYFGTPQWPTLADLLIADETNPRSFAFQVSSLLDHVQRLPGATSNAANASQGSEQQLLTSIKRRLSRLDLADLSEGERDPSCDPLPATLVQLAEQMRLVSEGITQRFFVHTPVSTS